MRSWNQDPYSRRARKENYAARSVYKLQEILPAKDFRNVSRVLDLGAAPGSWTQWCLESSPRLKVFAVDLAPLEFQNARLFFFHGAIEDVPWESFLEGIDTVDLVLSDMAPKTTGMASTDVARSLDLAETALAVAQKYLREGGTLVLKVFMGEGYEAFTKRFRSQFKDFQLLRPQATRKASREIYLIGRGFHPLLERTSQRSSRMLAVAPQTVSPSK